jgi:hypothetical protein
MMGSCEKALLKKRDRQSGRPYSKLSQFIFWTAILTDLLCPSERQRMPLNGDFRPCGLEVTIWHFACKLFAR